MYVKTPRASIWMLTLPHGSQGGDFLPLILTCGSAFAGVGLNIKQELYIIYDTHPIPYSLCTFPILQVLRCGLPIVNIHWRCYHPQGRYPCCCTPGFHKGPRCPMALGLSRSVWGSSGAYILNKVWRRLDFSKLAFEHISQ